ncbi:DUF3850 domain-containing protein [Micrococcus luteus]|uniref:DUF3850 domain-containing protein n=1 Tax=Micrococcus luteus TaxID=1270 RepID=UPI003413BE3D
MTVHYLKIEPRWLSRIRANQKHAEVRLDDRDYQAGDVIMFTYDNGQWSYVERRISHVLREAPGLSHGYVVLSLDDPRVVDLEDVKRERDRLVRSNRSLRAQNRKLRGAE